MLNIQLISSVKFNEQIISNAIPFASWNMKSAISTDTDSSLPADAYVCNLIHLLKYVQCTRNLKSRTFYTNEPEKTVSIRKEFDSKWR